MIISKRIEYRFEANLNLYGIRLYISFYQLTLNINSSLQFEPIHVMVDENDNVRYVVQHKEKFNQVIYIEQCL